VFRLRSGDVEPVRAQAACAASSIADAAETASAPFIEIGAIARWLLPFVLLMIGIVLGIYFAIR
jgi:hypothetical protein